MHHHDADDRHYLPGMGRRWLLPLYDPFTWLIGVVRHHRTLIDLADIPAGSRVLEIGCGTGNVALEAARRRPDALITGLDPDPAALERARRKARRRGLQVRFDHGFAQDLPYPDGAFDRVLSALMFHHLATDVKPVALAEACRVLAPGGTLHLLDVGGPVAASDGLVARFVTRSPILRDNVGDRIPTLMADAGLVHAREEAHHDSRLFGRLTFVRAATPQVAGRPLTG